MFCRNCGRELPENAKFCGGCGTPAFAPAVEPKLPEVPVEETPVVMEPPVEEPVQSGAAAPVQPVEPASDAETVLPVEPVSDAETAGGRQDELSAALEPSAAVVVAAATEMQPVPPVPPAGNAPVLAESKKKKGRGLLLLGIAAVAVIVLIVALVKLLPSGSKDVLVYLNDDDALMFRKDLKVKTKPVELTDDEASGVLFSKDGKYIYYLEDLEDTGGDYSETGTLYRVETAQIGKKGFSPEKISPDVSLYDIRVLDNGGAVYIRGSGSDAQLRCYDGKESYKLAGGVSSFILNEKGTYAYYTEYDSSDYTSSLYRVEVKDGGEKERLLKDANGIYSDYDAAVLVYGKSNGDDSGVRTLDIYSQKPGGDKTKLLSDVYSVTDVTVSGSKVSFNYVTAQVEGHTLYDFVTDSLAFSDAGEQEPSTNDYQTRNAWGWTTTDWDAYSAAYDKWLEVETRNGIRQELQNTNYNLTTYTLHRYEDGKDTVLAEGMSSGYLDRSVQDGIYIYAKSDQDVSAVCDVSDLEYWGDIYNRMNTSERTWYQNVNGTESELGLDEGASVNSLFVLNGKEAVLGVYEDGETILQAYSIGKDRLTFSSTVTDEYCVYLHIGKNGKQDVLYYMTNLSGDDSSGDMYYSSGDLMYYVDGKKTTVARDASQVVLLDDGKAVFKMEDVEYNSRREVTECSLYTVKDGKNERIADDVAMYNIAFLDARQALYISDGDLFVWNGSASEKLASDVTRFWTSRRADSQVFSLDW